MLNKTRLILLSGLLLTFFASGAALFWPVNPLRLAAAILLACFLPGWLVVEGLFAVFLPSTSNALRGNASPNAPHPIKMQFPERIILGITLSYVITIVGGLWLYYALGYLALTPLLTLYLLLALIGFAPAFWRARKPSTGKLTVSFAGIILFTGFLLFAAYFRFVFLANSDYRGDEAEVILRALAAIRAEDAPILSHTKGPAETLLAAAFGLLYGAFDELSVRLPFALANLLAVIGVYLLGKRLFNRPTAIIAALLAVINGWYITYGRTAQYQNLVLPLTILGLWATANYYRGRSTLYLALGAVFAAAATYGHYEGAAPIPAIVYLTVLGLKNRATGHWRTWRWSHLSGVLSAGIAASVIILSFYLPFFFNPTVVNAQHHLGKRFGQGFPFNNWDLFYVNALFYNATFYVWALAAILLAGTLIGIKQIFQPYRWGRLAPWLALPLLLLGFPGLLTPWYALLVYLMLMGIFLLSPQIQAPVKALLWAIFLPFLLYLFAVLRPGNHYYVFITPLLILAAHTLNWGWQRFPRPLNKKGRAALTVTAGLLATLYLLSAWYQHLVFMRPDLEYMLTYPQHRSALYPTDPRFPFGIRIGWGFPYRLGWQTVAKLYRSKELSGDWYANDANNSIVWYTTGAARNPCYPRYFMQGEITYKNPPLPLPAEIIDRFYSLKGTVEVRGQPRLRVYQFNPDGNEITPLVWREPEDPGSHYLPEMFQGQAMASAFQPETPLSPVAHFKPHPNMLAQLAKVYNDANVPRFKEEVSLLGYDLDLSRAKPGGLIILTLYWQADSPVFLPYKIFTHLEENGRLWAQADDEPGCGNYPTYTWRIGDKFIDRHLIFLPADIPPGNYPLQVGLYEVRTGLRMDLLDEMNNPAGNMLNLPPVTITTPSED